MARVSPGDEARLQAMLRQLFQSVKERITGAPSLECAEEVLLRLEETDDNFHNYEFVKYLRQHICNTLGSMIEEEMEKCMSDQNQGEEPGYYTAVRQITGKIQESAEYKDMMRTLKSLLTAAVASLSSGVEEEETPGPARQRRSRREPIGSYCTDNDSDSSFNQSYKFCPGKLQLIVDQLDPRQPKEVRLEALQVLCSAPPSDILTCESWTELCGRLTASLPDPDPGFSDRVLKFYAQMFTLLPLHMTKEIYISLMKYLELYFLSRENHIPLSAGVDVTNPNVTRLLKKVRLLSEYQKEAPSLWIRHSEKYMEEIVESTLSLLSVKHDQSHLVSPKILDPIYFFALVDPKAEWFKKWMHAYYSRTTVLKLLEKKYKSLITTAVQQCVQYLELCETMKADEILGHSKRCGDRWKTLYYSRQEVQYVCFIHSLCLLGRLLIYTQGRKLFPIKLKDRKDSVSLTDLLVLFIQLIYCSPSCPNTAPDLYLEDYSPASMVTDILRVLCDQKECAVECLYNSTVISTLLQPVHNLLKGTEGTCGLASLRDEEIGRAQKEQELLLMGSSISGVFQAALDCSETALIHAADILARIASAEEGLALLICEENTNSSSEESPAGAHTLAQFTRRLLDEEISAFSGSALLPVVQGAFLSVCCQIYGTCEGLQALLPYSLHEAVARAWRKTNLPSERIPTPPSGSHSVASVSQGSQNVSSSTRPVSGFREVRRVPKIASTKHTALSGKGSELHGHPHGQVLDVSASFKQVMSAGTKFSSRNVSSTKFDEFQSRQVPSMAWEENLLDDLLNFAATPRGLLLLQRTGVMSECVTFMSNQYARNLQVSRQKKIDYGVLLTQVASTAAGAVALQDSGFVSALVAGLWSSLECGVDDTRVTHPRSAPVDPIDQGCQKSFLALVSLLSSPAVYELLGHQDLPNRAEYSLREVPTCVTAADLLENLGYLSRAAPIHCFISRFLPALLASQTLRSRTSTVECRQVLSGLQAALDQREDIIDRLIVLNSEAKIHSLFNYEQSHIFGLRLLSVMCCDLDTLLLLESQYQVSRVLMCAQEENILETSRGHRSFIIDGLSVERNHVLVRMNLIGGPLERTLPPRTLEKGDNPYPWPMFSSYPLPHCYLLKPARNSDMKQDGDLGTLLSCFTVSDKQNEWIENCQRQFSKMMKAKPGVVSGGALGGLLEKFVLHLTENPSECFFPSVEYTAADAEVQPESLPSVQQLGVRMAVRCVQILALGAAVGSAYEADSMCEAPGHTLPPHSAVNLSAVVCSPVLVCSVISCHSVAMSTKAPKAPRYGKFLSLLKDGAEADLAWVLEHCERFLKLQRAPVRSSLLCLRGRYAGHDWFVSSLFLMLSGDREKTLRVLLRFSRLLASAFLWLPRLHLSTVIDICGLLLLNGLTPKSCLPADTARSGIPPAYFCGAHCTEMLLKSEVPLVFSAFRMSGFAPSQICLQWITQCFWNYLDWIEICHYIATCVFLGPDYQVYICIAVFKHLQQEILQHTQTQDLQVFLKEEALRGFRVSDYFEYMEMLEQNYRPALLRDMRNISVQST